MRNSIDTPATADVGDELPGERGLRSVLTFTSDRVTYVHPTTSIRDAAVTMHGADISLAVVSDESGVQGVVSERDISRAVSAGLDVDVSTVADVETDDLIWMPQSASVDEVAEVMIESFVRHVLIGDGLNDLVGVVSIRDLLHAYLV